MKAIMVMFDSLNREFLPNYGCTWTKMPNFEKLKNKTITFDNFYAGSLPCIPTRRELHTGRYNFLHTPWSPMQPFDDSIIVRMKKAGIYTHIVTDHFHYWEDGGSCYLTKFDSHEIIRGQQGDPWIGKVQWPNFLDTLSRRKTGENWRHDWVNREFIKSESDMPQNKTFERGIEFIKNNCSEDNWFLQIEAFDPHEPFFTQQKYKDLYPHNYRGKNLDWPDYGVNDYGDEATEHVRYEYAALLSMCDHSLGKIIDIMDEKNLWEDTMLIVNTDHGFLLGEKDSMGKNVQPFYNELVHIPFFIYDPKHPCTNERRTALSQTIDIVPTLAEFFEIDPPDFIDGKSLTPILKENQQIRDSALFGIYGGHINITDGQYVYMRSSISKDNSPLFNYTLMPCNMNAPYPIEDLDTVTLTKEFEFTKHTNLLKVQGKTLLNSYWYGSMLFDLEKDSLQMNPIINPEKEIELISKMRKLMIANEAPKEQFDRIGIPIHGDINKDCIFKKESLILDNIFMNREAEIVYELSLAFLPKKAINQFKNDIDQKSTKNKLNIHDVVNSINLISNNNEIILRQIRNYIKIL